MSNVAVFLDRVTRRFGATVAVRELSLDIRQGEMFGLIGPDGAGKTTTIRLLCGLLKPDEGTIRVLGHDPVRDHGAITRTVGYFSQRFSLYGDLSIDENIAFFAEIHGLRRYGKRRDELLDMTQLTRFRGRLAEQLSGGMKQKLALACTLVHQPSLILLDEPTTGVDPVSRREFWKLLSQFLAQGITIVMTTPYLDEAERCSRVALLHQGRLLAMDSPARLRSRLTGQVVEVIAQPQQRVVALMAGDPDATDAQMFGERVHVRFATTEGAAAVERVRAALGGTGIAITSLRPVPASLEDVFIDEVTRVKVKGSGNRADIDTTNSRKETGSV